MRSCTCATFAFDANRGYVDVSVWRKVVFWMGLKFGFFLVLVSLIFDGEIAFVKFACLLAHEGTDRHEIDELHLQLESKICVLSSEELVSLAGHLGVESKE